MLCNSEHVAKEKNVSSRYSALFCRQDTKTSSNPFTIHSQRFITRDQSYKNGTGKMRPWYGNYDYDFKAINLESIYNLNEMIYNLK